MILTDDIVDSVLRPFDGDSGQVGPDGRDPADETLYEEFRVLKRERKAIGRAGRGSQAAEESNSPPDIAGRWATLGEEAARYVAERSKDLEILAILVEASLRVDGLPGLVQALSLQRRFIEEYWEKGMFPREDEDGVATRFHPLSALSGGGTIGEGTLIGPLRQTPLLEGLVYADKLTAEAKFNAAIKDKADPEEGAKLKQAAQAAFDGFAAAANGAGLASARATIGMLERAEQEWGATREFVAARTERQRLPMSALSDELKEIREWLVGLLGNRLTEAEAVGAEASDGGAAAVAVSVPGGVGPGPIAGRGGALTTMLAIAEFFEKTEPLSPIGPALRSLHRRAQLSFDDLVAELLPESGSREGFYTRLGIKPPALEE
jgi:type VI secretion system protein ImpA